MVIEDMAIKGKATKDKALVDLDWSAFFMSYTSKVNQAIKSDITQRKKQWVILQLLRKCGAQIIQKPWAMNDKSTSKNQEITAELSISGSMID